MCKQYKRWICPIENIHFKVILQPSLSLSQAFVVEKIGNKKEDCNSAKAQPKVMALERNPNQEVLA